MPFSPAAPATPEAAAAEAAPAAPKAEAEELPLNAVSEVPASAPSEEEEALDEAESVASVASAPESVSVAAALPTEEPAPAVEVGDTLLIGAALMASTHNAKVVMNFIFCCVFTLKLKILYLCLRSANCPVLVSQQRE